MPFSWAISNLQQQFYNDSNNDNHTDSSINNAFQCKTSLVPPKQPVLSILARFVDMTHLTVTQQQSDPLL